MEGLHNLSGFHCRRCNRPDSADANMVACDNCNMWEHFTCAGVDETIKARAYLCQECMVGEPLRQESLLIPKPPKPDGSTSSSTRAALLEANMKILEEEQFIKEQAAREYEALRNREMAEKQRQIAEKKMLMEEERRLRELKLEEDKTFQAKQQLIRQESLEQKRKLLQQIAAEASSKGGSTAGSLIGSKEKVSAWLGRQGGRSTGNESGDSRKIDSKSCEIPSDPSGSVKDEATGQDHIRDHPIPPSDGATGQDHIRDRPIPPSPTSNYDNVSLDGAQQVVFPQAQLSPQVNARPGRHPAMLGTQQIAARHVLGKELPPFSGNPEDWPIFISSFEQSTATCGFSDAENLIRLQRSLKGRALESVRSRLLLPSGVTHVIQTLRTLYGRPELLIRSLIGKIKNVPAPRYDRLETIMEFGLAVQNLVDHLVAAQQENHLSNPVLMQELAEKLPGTLRLEWAMYKNRDATPTLRTFGSFMSRLVTAASEVTFDLPYTGADERQRTRAHIQTHLSDLALPPIANSSPVNRKTGRPCAVCDREGHRVAECNTFKAMTVEERSKLVQQKSLCRTCLNNHGKWPCKSWQGCDIEGCRLKHNSLLHQMCSTAHSVNVSATFPTSMTDMFPFFRIIPVVLYGGKRSRPIFAFIDEGSSLTLLEKAVAEELGLAGIPEPLTLRWTGNVTREESLSQKVQLNISGDSCATRYKLLNARTVSSLVLPSQTLKYHELSQMFPHLRGLPVKDYELVQPKLLIGLDNLRLGVPLKVRQGQSGEPIAAKCRLGWGIYGCVPSKTNTFVNFHTAEAADSDFVLNEQLRDYFTLENMGVLCPGKILESEEDQRARRLLKETTRRTASGFETGLLWKTDDLNFPNNYPMAMRRLQSLERKLQKEPLLKQRVSKLIAEYKEKKYAHKANKFELSTADSKRVWYLPLGVVINPKKPSKIRLIWDAAAKTDGVSFNSQLLKGPDLLTPLPTVLSQFRQYPIAVCGDIKEMFHQIKIREQDCQSQRFLWRENPTDRPEIYVMDVATFGSTCSPASAQYVKNINAEEFAEQYPRASTAIQKKHYVDDYLDSFPTIQEAIEVVNDVKAVHLKGGFELRNFLSNSIDVLKGIGEIPAKDSKCLLLDKEENAESVLGMRWIPKDDVFTYSFALRNDLQPILAENYIPTKREVLKVLMSLFDPLGFICFFLVHGKILMQDIWASGSEWDDRINIDLYQRWKQWTDLFPQLNTIRIPRCYFRSPYKNNLQIHVFVDASEAAYSCVAYFRLASETGIEVSLIGAKSKVAPLKMLTIPKLELKAAVLGVRYLESIQNYHTFDIHQRYLWTDSTTVLAWITSDHRRYNKFVAFRVSEILSSTDQKEWRWLPSKLNAADEATKWKSGPNLPTDGAWFRGQCFLHEPEGMWPKTKQVSTTEEELRHVHLHSNPTPLIDVARYSQWVRLQRSMAFVLRFISNLKHKTHGLQMQLGILQCDELAAAEEALWKLAQMETYPKEIALLKRTQGDPETEHAIVPKNSTIYKAWPFLDRRGILRMRSRSGAAAFAPFEAKYPTILPKQHLTTFLITDWYHRRFRHANRETVVNEMRQRFEIPRLRVLIQMVIKNCAQCRITKALPKVPAMAPLPPCRVTPFVRPFTFVGLDYFGPVFVRVGRSQVKRWIALFTCLTVRAVHMEVVHSLSTESCIMAVRRFVARRGPPAEFHTDNATCFQGASRELQNEITARNNALASTFTSAQTRWKFIPPATPHMGGAWERLVRSVKTAIGSISDAPRKPDDETLETIIYEAEAMVNCRPLTYIPLESADQEALTPNHFILGSSTGTKNIPSEFVSGSAATLRSSWKLAQFITNEFWKRWIKEYLPVITRRCKWFENTKDLQVGDLVLAVGGAAKNQWIRGRVVQVIQGRDGKVRQAIVQTTAGVMRRSAIQLAVLDVAKSSKPGNDQTEPSDDHQGSRVGECDDETPCYSDASSTSRPH
ncbi:uncharacterized protein LOC131680519 [Topomyia yanbarensis]|uniref:uncharacterized protein LOC131680519 n=1 Tax=Topomyia yanbarensis TaxID=2498891 RepID=UPI00273C4955|nr:uncharacterized protein LOC131680519 [Topomyia yanbarensis]